MLVQRVKKYDYDNYIKKNHNHFNKYDQNMMSKILEEQEYSVMDNISEHICGHHFNPKTNAEPVQMNQINS